VHSQLEGVGYYTRNQRKVEIISSEHITERKKNADKIKVRNRKSFTTSQRINEEIMKVSPVTFLIFKIGKSFQETRLSLKNCIASREEMIIMKKTSN